MEQSLGKRISQNRKRLGLTQDALAEQLGVTAQAVSKWENDQSCPDITILPRLAEIFGCSTDQLLGVEPEEPVHEAQVVCEPEEKEKSSWELTWDAGRHGALTFAVLVLLVGALCVADVLLHWDVGFWSILWPSAMLVYGFSSLIKKFSFFSFGCGLFGIYFLMQNLGIWQLDLSGELIFPAIIVLFGISLLVDALRKPKKSGWKIKHNGAEVTGLHNATKDECYTGNSTFECDLSFGNGHHLIALPFLTKGEIDCTFGDLTVDLSGCEAISSDCKIEADCSFGQLTLLVPKRFRIEPDRDTTFADFSVSGQPDAEPQGAIRLAADVSFGKMTVRYI